jgi:SprT-like family
MTRDQWLKQAVRLFRPLFRRIGFKLPRVVTARAEICHPHNWGETGFPNQTRLSPKIDEAYQALTVLAHELCHQAANEWLSVQSGHGPTFKHIANKVGMEPITGGFPVQLKLQKQCLRWAKKLGKYPTK